MPRAQQDAPSSTLSKGRALRKPNPKLSPDAYNCKIHKSLDKYTRPSYYARTTKATPPSSPFSATNRDGFESTPSETGGSDDAASTFNGGRVSPQDLADDEGEFDELRGDYVLVREPDPKATRRSTRSAAQEYREYRRAVHQQDRWLPGRHSKALPSIVRKQHRDAEPLGHTDSTEQTEQTEHFEGREQAEQYHGAGVAEATNDADADAGAEEGEESYGNDSDDLDDLNLLENQIQDVAGFLSQDLLRAQSGQTIFLENDFDENNQASISDSEAEDEEQDDDDETNNLAPKAPELSITIDPRVIMSIASILDENGIPPSTLTGSWLGDQISSGDQRSSRPSVPLRSAQVATQRLLHAASSIALPASSGSSHGSSSGKSAAGTGSKSRSSSSLSPSISGPNRLEQAGTSTGRRRK